MKVVLHNKKKLQLYLEELPLIEQATKDKLALSDRELETLSQAIRDGETLLKEVQEK